jgi:hypothetical protein
MPTAAKESEKNVYQRMHAVMAEIERVDKDKVNSFHKYAYASEQAIKEAVHPLLVKHGIVFTLSVNKQEVLGDRTCASFSYRFINIDNPEDGVGGTFCAQGEDKGDKGIYKAITGAVKYIMTSSFLIPTGDDPEKDSPASQEAHSAPRAAEPAKPTYQAEDKPVDGTYEVEVKDVKYGTSKTGKDYELVYTDSGRMFNNSGITMPVGKASVTVKNGSIFTWAAVRPQLFDQGEIDTSDVPF